MYKAGDSVMDYTSNGVYLVEILDPQGDIIALVLEFYVDALLSHLNKG